MGYFRVRFSCLLAIGILLLSTSTQAQQQAEPLTAQSPPVKENDQANNFERNMEWFGMNQGVSLHIGGKYQDGHPSNGKVVSFAFLLRQDIRLFTLQIPHFYITLFELHPFYFIYQLGFGMRMGLRIPLMGSYRKELRIGAYIGADHLAYNWESFYYHLCIEPHIEYRYNHNCGSLGVGFGIPYFRHFESEYASHENENYYMPRNSIAFLLYFKFSLGRTTF